MNRLPPLGGRPGTDLGFCSVQSFCYLAAPGLWQPSPPSPRTARPAACGKPDRRLPAAQRTRAVALCYAAWRKVHLWAAAGHLPSQGASAMVCCAL